jgi:hypothetical protein
MAENESVILKQITQTYNCKSLHGFCISLIFGREKIFKFFKKIIR